MGLLKTLGLKRTGRGGPGSDDMPSPRGPPSPSPGSLPSPSPIERRRMVPASGPLTPTLHMPNSFDIERTKEESKSDGELEDGNDEEEDSGRVEASGNGTSNNRQVDGLSELRSPAPTMAGVSSSGDVDPLQERSLRREQALVNRNRSNGGLEGVGDFSGRVLRGGSLRTPGGGFVPPDGAEGGGGVGGAATVADKPARHRRNPSLETILRNMYSSEGGGAPPAAPSPRENGRDSPHSSGARSGQLAPRDFGPDPVSQPSRMSRARSGVLAPRDWGTPSPADVSNAPPSRVSTNTDVPPRAARSGQLTARDFSSSQDGPSAVRSTRQVAPDDSSAKPMPKTGGSGTLQAIDWSAGPAAAADSDSSAPTARSRSGQLLARDVTGGGLAADRFKGGPRSMSSHSTQQKDAHSGQRQQKGAAQRRLSRNKGPVSSSEDGGDSSSSSSSSSLSSSSGGSGLGSVGARRAAARAGRTSSSAADTWQEPIAEENENGSGQLQPVAPTARKPPPLPDTAGLPAPIRARPQAPAAGVRPQTASERLAASLAASVASMQAQKSSKATMSGSMAPSMGVFPSRSRDGPSDNVLQRPFANVREKYQLQMEELGRGRFGVIRMCLDRKSGEKLACKSISKARLKAWQDADDVRKEVTVMELLQGHPHVVNLKGAFEDALNVHLVMELCEGGELFDRIMAKKRYTEQEAAIVCRTVVGVLRYCHALGYIHRDLKPENILLCSKDNDTSVKVIDFGVATPFKTGEPCTEEVGTPFYLAPEVLSKSYGPEADIWSAGVVLYILLCGVPPFWAKDTEGIRLAIKEGNLDLTSGPWKTVSDSAKDLVRQMLTMDPAERIKGDQILAHPWIASLGRS